MATSGEVVKIPLDNCPSWCSFKDNMSGDPHEHVSGQTIRSSFCMEIMRYYGDDVTYVALLQHMDGGQEHVLIPMPVLTDLTKRAQEVAAATSDNGLSVP